MSATAPFASRTSSRFSTAKRVTEVPPLFRTVRVGWW